jgi:hypothetical protein
MAISEPWAVVLRILQLSAWVFIAVFGLALAGIVTTMPALGASICPSCFGLRHMGQNIYADIPSTRLASEVTQARNRVAAAWGRLRAEPLILICQTDLCHSRLGGGQALGMTYGEWAVHIGPKGANATIIAHELAHAELFHRIGILSIARGEVPAWLNEGLAVIISNDPRYLQPDCGPFAQIDLPETASEWRSRASVDHVALYTAAACQTQDWLAARGGLHAIGNISK